VLLYEYLDKITESSKINSSRFDHSTLQRLITNDVFVTYGWDSDSFSDHDYDRLREGYFNKDTYSRHESIGKSYALTSYYKSLSIIFDNYLIDSVHTSSEKF